MDTQLPFPRLPHKHHTNIMENMQLPLSRAKGIPEKLQFCLKSNKISLLDLYVMHPSNEETHCASPHNFLIKAIKQMYFFIDWPLFKNDATKTIKINPWRCTLRSILQLLLQRGKTNNYRRRTYPIRNWERRKACGNYIITSANVALVTLQQPPPILQGKAL